MMNLAGFHPAQTLVVMLLVVPFHRRSTPFPSLVQAAEISWVIGSCFERFELRFAVGVVVAHTRTRVRLFHTKIHKQLAHRFRGHLRASVCVKHQLVGLDPLFFARFQDQMPAQFAGFSLGQHPSHHVSRVHIHDHIEIVVLPLLRAGQFGNVPGPDLVWHRGDQPRHRIRWVFELVSSLVNHVILAQNSVHGGYTTKISPLVEQGGVDLVRRHVDKPRTVEHAEHLVTLSRTQGPR
jgi:hypothetical protein